MTSSALLSAFAPFETLAALLIARLPDHGDGAHDLAHLMRVWKTVRRLEEGEGGDLEIPVAATILHDAVNVEKSSPDRATASARSAQFAGTLFQDPDWPDARCAQVALAIEAQSHSAGVAATTLETCILQDADRLDAIGAIGVAGCFYTAVKVQRPRI